MIKRATLRRQMDCQQRAIAEGLRTPDLEGRLEDLEPKLAAIDSALEAPGAIAGLLVFQSVGLLQPQGCKSRDHLNRSADLTAGDRDDLGPAEMAVAVPIDTDGRMILALVGAVTADGAYDTHLSG